MENANNNNGSKNKPPMSLTPKGYIPRLLDNEVGELLQIFGAVEIDGPKWCGKTWLALNHARSVIHLDDEEGFSLVQADTSLALTGTSPHLIDEWQEVPRVRDAVRRRVDATGSEPGSYLLTGSSTPAPETVHHSGTGRIATIQLRPMSLYETGLSDGSISLHGLFDEDFTSKQVDTRLEVLAAEICRGGWPAGRHLELKRALRVPRQYMTSIYNFSAPKMGKSGDIARRVFTSLARTAGRSASYATIAADISEGETKSASSKIGISIVEGYLEFFKRLYILEDLPGWDAPVGARARVRTRPKRYLTDPSLATAALGISPDKLLGEMQEFGRLFELLCIRDLRIYLSAHPDTTDVQLRYYLDDYGLEVDAIVELPDGRWGAFEIKLSEDKVPSAVNNLIRLKEKVCSNPLAQAKEPSFLAVLVGRTQFARKTAEGVLVIPITCLTI
jgi:predicted AAA+ superfamily ATPase